MGQLSKPRENFMKPGDLVVGKLPKKKFGYNVTSLVGMLIEIKQIWNVKVRQGKWDEHVEDRRLWSVLTVHGLVEELESRMEIIRES